MKNCQKLLILSVLFLSACASQNSEWTGKKTQGHWEAKAQIRDLKKDKTNTVSIDFQMRDPQSLRAEITGTLGIAVASLTVQPDKFQLSVHTQKKFYQGANTMASLQNSVGLPIEPSYLLDLLLDEPLPTSDFQCQNDAEGRPALCKSLKTDLTFEWRERQGELKRLVIKRPDFDMQILIKSFNRNVQSDPGFYTLAIPSSYKVYQLD